MTVYFARKVSDPTSIKIGTANNVAKRLSNVARAVGPLHLFGSMSGGVATERKIQIKFAHLRTEGEWFRSDEELESYIRAVSDKQDAEFGTKNNVWTTKAIAPLSRRKSDAMTALKLLDAIFDRYPRQTSVSRCLEMAFEELHAQNEGWSRRRVRALHEMQGLRVDAFELIDMLTLLGVPRTDWADWLSPLPAVEVKRAA